MLTHADLHGYHTSLIARHLQTKRRSLVSPRKSALDLHSGGAGSGDSDWLSQMKFNSAGMLDPALSKKERFYEVQY